MLTGGFQTILGHFGALDGVALAVHLIVWLSLTWLIENKVIARPSTYQLMLHYRRAWMEAFLTREPRVFDGIMLSSLKQTATFFASTCLLAVGAGAALIGQVDRVSDLASDLSPTLTAPAIVWQVKLLVVLVFVSNALLKFLWAVRVYGYQAVVMSAVPNDPASDEARRMALRAAELNIWASRGFNRGLRALYFSLAALTWLIGPLAFLVATLVTSIMVIRREYFSASRTSLIFGE